MAYQKHIGEGVNRDVAVLVYLMMLYLLILEQRLKDIDAVSAVILQVLWKPHKTDGSMNIFKY